MSKWRNTSLLLFKWRKEPRLLSQQWQRSLLLHKWSKQSKLWITNKEARRKHPKRYPNMNINDLWEYLQCPNGGRLPYCCENGANNVDCCLNNGKGPNCELPTQTTQRPTTTTTTRLVTVRTSTQAPTYLPPLTTTTFVPVSHSLFLGD